MIRSGREPAPREVRDHVQALRDRGLSLRAIAEALNEQEIPTPQGGQQWRASSVRSVLTTTEAPEP